jgi:hypothetical protein
MKRLVMMFVLGLVVIGLAVVVVAEAVMTGADDSGIEVDVTSRIKAGKYAGEGGEQIQVQEEAGDRIRLRVRNASADTNLTIVEEKVQNRTKLVTRLSNGRKAEIKIMPDVASETALMRLRLKVCNETNNCTIQLKEVGVGNQTRAAYEVSLRRRAKVFGFIGTGMRVKTEVDAENGDVIRIRKPWWAFLASEPEEE